MSAFAQSTFDRLDGISRVRALTEAESRSLQNAIRYLDERIPAKPPAERTCSHCERTIYRYSKSGVCRPCHIKTVLCSPAVQERARARRCASSQVAA